MRFGTRNSRKIGRSKWDKTRLLASWLLMIGGLGVLAVTFPSPTFAQEATTKAEAAKPKNHKGSANRTEKYHRLVRKPSFQVTESTRTDLTAVSTSGGSLSMTSTAVGGASRIESSVASSENTAFKNGAMGFSSGQPTTRSSVAGSTAASIGIASLSSPSPSSNTSSTARTGHTSGNRGGGRSAQRLVAELPNLSQIVAPSAPPAPVSPPPPPPLPAVIGASPMSFSFTATQGANAPAPQTLSITNTGGGTLTWSAADNASWLSVSPANGVGNGTVALSVSPGSLNAGTHSATLSISATGTSTVTIPVTVTVSAAPVPPNIGMSPTSLSFSAQQGGSNPAGQTLNISNTGGGTLSWSATDNAAWLTLSPANGTGNGTLTLSASTAGLTAGNYSAIVTLSGNSGVTNKSVPVNFTVTAPPPPPPQPTISMSPTSLSFNATAGGTNPGSKTILISNSGTGTLSWSTSDNAGWLTTTQSGNSVVAAINVAGLTAGTYSAVITVTASGATNTPQNVPVTLTVSAPPPPTTGSVTLTWNANSESDLAGYKVYRGTASGAYGAPIASLPTGTTQHVSNGLPVGTYFFVITAYDQAGNESAPSPEVSKSIY